MSATPLPASKPGTKSQQSQSKRKEQLVKLTILAYRNPKLTEAEFHHHWTHVHAPKVSAHLAKFGIMEYRQHHTPSRLRDSLSSKVPSLNVTTTSDQWAEYDGYVELLMPELECYERARTDQYYLDVVVPDEEYFADMGRSKVAVGWEEVWVEGGKVVKVETEVSEEEGVEEGKVQSES